MTARGPDWARHPGSSVGPNMRCARCDRIVLPQALGRLPDGRLAFGWCLHCLNEERCEVVEVGPMGRRWRRRRWIEGLRRLEPLNDRQRLALCLTGLLAAWGLVLASLGGIRLARPPASGRIPVVPREVLVVAGVLLTTLGLALGVAVLDRPRRSLMLKLLQAAASLVALAALLWGIARHDPRGNPAVVGVVAVALAGFALARWFDRRLEGNLPARDPTEAVM